MTSFARAPVVALYDRRPTTMTRGQVVKLLDEVETLREQVRQYQEALAPETVFPLTWRLRPQARTVLTVLHARRGNLVAYERLTLAVAGTHPDLAEPSRGHLGMLVMHIRRALAAAGIPEAVSTFRGQGYVLTVLAGVAVDQAVFEYANDKKPRRATTALERPLPPRRNIYGS